jgi:CheY-like chemotaxis protein
MPAAPRLDGVVILVVEDDPDSRDLVKRVLEGQGASVITALTGTEALRIVEKKPPDVLLSDIWLPELDGYTLKKSAD